MGARTQSRTTNPAGKEADPLLTVRLPASLSLSIKSWAKQRGMNRSAAARYLLELGLQADVGKQRQSSERQQPEVSRDAVATKSDDRVIGK
jgi:hypothetical protein